MNAPAPSEQQPALWMESVARRYDGRFSLQAASLTLQPGVCTAIVGPNGSGKTTLLKLALGLIRPDRGVVRVLGQEVRPFPRTLTGRVLSVIDSIEPPPWVTVSDTASLYQSIAPERFDPAFAQSALAELRVAPRQCYRSLSKGQRRWLLNVLALACRPDLLVLDEPTDGLDPVARPRLYQMVRQLINERGASVLFATHILSEVDRAADRVLFMDVGRIVFEADLEMLREQIVELELPNGSSVGAEVFRGLVPDAQVVVELEDQRIRVLTLRLPTGFDRERLKPFGWLRPFNLERFYRATVTGKDITLPDSPAPAAQEVA